MPPNRPERHNSGPSRRPADPMNVPTRGLEGWRMAIVAGGASILGILVFVAIFSGFEPLAIAAAAAGIGLFLGFALVVMYLTGAL